MSTPSKKWILKSSDGETFEVDEAVLSESVTFTYMMEDLAGEGSVTIHNVKANILAKVIEYCKKHVETRYDAVADANADADAAAAAEAAVKAELKKFDAEFVKFDWQTLLDLLMVANYLNIPGLQALMSQAIADYIQDRKPEQVMRLFNIENDITEEEEKELKKEYEWPSCLN